jgi:hypothetical protein
MCWYSFEQNRHFIVRPFAPERPTLFSPTFDVSSTSDDSSTSDNSSKSEFSSISEFWSTLFVGVIVRPNLFREIMFGFFVDFWLFVGLIFRFLSVGISTSICSVGLTSSTYWDKNIFVDLLLKKLFDLCVIRSNNIFHSFFFYSVCLS